MPSTDEPFIVGGRVKGRLTRVRLSYRHAVVSDSQEEAVRSHTPR